MSFSDILIIFTCILTAGIFSFLGTDRLYRFYFGLIMGFLLFLMFNFQIRVIELSGNGINLTAWENFLTINKQTILGFFSLMIPVFGFLFAFIDSEIKSNKLFSLLFGFLLPTFGLGILAYVTSNSSIELGFLKETLSFFKDSKIFELLLKAPRLVFGLLLMVIFWKYIFAIIINFLAYLAKLITAEVNELRGEEEIKEKEESKRIKLN